MPQGRRLAVIGGGWAGLAAAIEATRRGDRVTLFEMANRLGGRARSLEVEGLLLDNGQHICIGAYAETLRLLRVVGVSEDAAFLRMPLRIGYADGASLELRAGAPIFAFAAAVWRHPRWSRGARMALLASAARWMLNRFQCDPAWTVDQLVAEMPADVRTELIEPLCVAALNTPSDEASAVIFLRVLKDALFSGRGSADLLLPRVDLDRTFPEPARRWLAAAGAFIRTGRRVGSLDRGDGVWSVDGEVFDAVVMAASPVESARLVRSLRPDWADAAAGLPYEPIVTVYLRSGDTVLPQPMLALRSGAGAPAQFVFDRGQLGGPPGLLAFVVSGAKEWVESGSAATADATLAQAQVELGGLLRCPLETVQVVTEKRATFRCFPGLRRPVMRIAPGLVAAGDHVEGPYPSSLEGATRSGVTAVQALSEGA